MARIVIPPADVPVVDPKTGLMDSDWYDAFKAMERLGLLDLADVSTVAPADTQVLIWDAASSKWIPGAN